MYQETLQSGHHNAPWNRHAKPFHPTAKPHSDIQIYDVTIKGQVKVRHISLC
jgi:hypothetical protein